MVAQKFSSCYSQSPLLRILPSPPPPPPSKSGLKLVCNVYGNKNSQDYARKPQRNCTFMNSTSGPDYCQFSPAGLRRSWFSKLPVQYFSKYLSRWPSLCFFFICDSTMDTPSRSVYFSYRISSISQLYVYEKNVQDTARTEYVLKNGALGCFRCTLYNLVENSTNI